jgi:hypothetical protein
VQSSKLLKLNARANVYLIYTSSLKANDLLENPYADYYITVTGMGFVICVMYCCNHVMEAVNRCLDLGGCSKCL